jgi:hypothetical protein
MDEFDDEDWADFAGPTTNDVTSENNQVSALENFDPVELRIISLPPYHAL